jgi:heme/copper-type cytochrome/quinol oxidase subunit 2
MSRRVSRGYRFALAMAWLLAVQAGLMVGATPAAGAVTAAVVINTLLVTGDAANNPITLRVSPLDDRDVEVLDGTVSLGTFKRTLFTAISVSGLGGSDRFAISRAFGPITAPVTLNGGDGSDTMDVNGSDATDNVQVTPVLPDLVQVVQDGVELARMRNTEALVVNLLGGSDNLIFIGTSANDIVTIAPNGNRVRMVCDTGSVTLDVGNAERIIIQGHEGDDQITASDNLTAVGVVALNIDGGQGHDTLTGSDTIDVMSGDDGNDILRGEKGTDRLGGGRGVNSLSGGPGDDTFDWAEGDGNTTFFGQEGVDRLFVFGMSTSDDLTIASAASTITPTPGAEFAIRRGTGEVAIVGGVERPEIRTFGGDDTIAVRFGAAGIDMFVDGGGESDVITVTADAMVRVEGEGGFDVLIFDALNRPISVVGSTIAVGGVTRVTHVTVEVVDFLNLLGELPKIDITTPTTSSTATATAPFLTVAGTATDAGGLASITVVNDRGGSATSTVSPATGALGFVWTAAHVPLVAGANVLTATARDAAGNEIRDTVTVNVTAFTYTMAEGATGSFFDTDILLANPNLVEAPVSITYLRGDGTTVPQTLTLAPTSRTTIRVDQIPGLENAEVSATVTSTAAVPLVVERTMRWDATGYGAHTDKATEGPSTTWFFAEGAQGFFDTYVLLANPGTTPNTATVTFLLENGAPIVKTFPLAPTSRRTVPANSIPEIVGQSFGITVTFTEPGVAERAMYFGAPLLFSAGHESAGVNAPATSWFLAEGATGSFFTTFVLLANPGTVDATATVTFLPDNGQVVTKTITVPAGRRVTLNIATEDSSLANSAVATAVKSTQPILVERAQYWPFTVDRWHEAHNSFGSTATGTKWGLAEGRVGGPENYQTYILFANADASEAAEVRIRFLRTNGSTVVKTFTVAPTSRLNVPVNSLSELANESFGALIEVTSGPGIFAERALSSDAAGVVFAAGTNTLATRLP